MLKNETNAQENSNQTLQTAIVLPPAPPLVREVKVSHSPEFLAQQNEFYRVRELQRLFLLNRVIEPALNTEDSIHAVRRTSRPTTPYSSHASSSQRSSFSLDASQVTTILDQVENSQDDVQEISSNNTNSSKKSA